MEALANSPEASSFVPLAEHQSRTPSSFYSGPPVLYHHSQRCKIVTLERDLLTSPLINALRGDNAANSVTSQDGDEKEVAISDVDVWVTSDKFFLFSPIASTGVSIPYPSISLHALQRLRIPGSDAEVQGLYMQIATPGAPTEEDEDEDSIAITVVLPADAPTQESADADAETETPTQQLYGAVSACSYLHPDPVEDDSDDEGAGSKFITAEEHEGVYQLENGDLPPPVDGSSGWITAENMDQFFDADGNWIAGGEPPSFPLGPGAGTIRTREEENGVEENRNEDETKWRKTD